jgi:hypothetical protein
MLTMSKFGHVRILRAIHGGNSIISALFRMSNENMTKEKDFRYEVFSVSKMVQHATAS